MMYRQAVDRGVRTVECRQIRCGHKSAAVSRSVRAQYVTGKFRILSTYLLSFNGIVTHRNFRDPYTLRLAVSQREIAPINQPIFTLDLLSSYCQYFRIITTFTLGGHWLMSISRKPESTGTCRNHA